MLLELQKKKKHDKILVLAKSKLNSIETLSQALIDMEITHQEFITILNEKDKYGKMKENVRNVSEKQENMIIVLIQGLKNVFCVFS